MTRRLISWIQTELIKGIPAIDIAIKHGLDIDVVRGIEQNQIYGKDLALDDETCLGHPDRYWKDEDEMSPKEYSGDDLSGWELECYSGQG